MAKKVKIKKTLVEQILQKAKIDHTGLQINALEGMIPEGITVALGTDNICDYMVPLCEGDLWQELSLLAAGCRFPHLDAMVDIASINGRKVLGLEPV